MIHMSISFGGIVMTMALVAAGSFLVGYCIGAKR